MEKGILTIKYNEARQSFVSVLDKPTRKFTITGRILSITEKPRHVTIHYLRKIYKSYDITEDINICTISDGMICTFNKNSKDYQSIHDTDIVVNTRNDDEFYTLAKNTFELVLEVEYENPPLAQSICNLF